jgi:hypothetical protein
MNNEIRTALLESHPNDLPAIRQYVAWVKFRRRAHNVFYTPAHWVQGTKRATYHWL